MLLLLLTWSLFCNLLVLKDPDSNPYSLLDNTESDQTADTDASESHHNTNRRRRSRRRRTDEDAVLMDGMTESDTASVNENGLGMYTVDCSQNQMRFTSTRIVPWWCNCIWYYGLTIHFLNFLFCLLPCPSRQCPPAVLKGFNYNCPILEPEYFVAKWNPEGQCKVDFI